MMPNDQPDHRIVLARHAETEWSEAGKHTGTTDLPLTEYGRRAATLIGDRLDRWQFETVLTSPLDRARTTCELAGFGEHAIVRDDLCEWDYGDYEGLTTAEIRVEQPGWELWTDGAPNGESPNAVSSRLDSVVNDLASICERGGDALLFGHGHSLRALAVRWVGLPIDSGRLLLLGTGAVCVLGWKRDLRVIEVWNDQTHMTTGTKADSIRGGVGRR